MPKISPTTELTPADVVVTDGDLLEIRTQIKQLFVAGRRVPLETKHTRLYERYLNRP